METALPSLPLDRCHFNHSKTIRSGKRKMRRIPSLGLKAVNRTHFDQEIQLSEVNKLDRPRGLLLLASARVLPSTATSVGLSLLSKTPTH